MGLLSFKKKSRKQQQQLNDKPFELTHHFQPPPELPAFMNGSLSTNNTFKLESSNARATEISLMDDIMNELDSAKSVSNYRDAPPITRPNKATVAKNPAFMTSQQHSSASTISIPALDNNRVSRTSMQKQQQPKPKPLLSFSDSNLNMKSTKDVNSDSADRDDLKAILASKPASPPPPPLVQQQTQTQTAASPPAYNIATNNNTSRNLMDRMKERHRLEARRSLQPSPFMDNTQARTNNLSSPSMPIIFSATSSSNSPITATAPKDIRPSPKPLVQSHSFTTYAKPTTPPMATVVTKQRPQLQQPLVRSVSDLNDMYTMASRPIQTQSDISLHKRASPPPLKQLRMSQSPSITNVRNSYLQTGPVKSAAYEEEQDMFRAPINAQQQIQQQHIQQQIELQQQQLQEQQRMQQQKLQQLQIQQQQQQILNQTLLETTAAANAAAAAVAASAAAAAATAPLKINQHRRDAPKAAIARSESRLIDTKHTSKSNASNVPDTPPPDSPHTTMFSNELTARASPVQDSDNAPEKKLTAIEETLIANSSTSTLTEGGDLVANTTASTTTIQPNKAMSKVIRLPEKLKQELQSMQLRRSTYSVPDLTTFSSDDDDDATEQHKDWSTIEMFDSGTMAHEPIKDATAITVADMNPSQSSPELLMFESHRHSGSSFHLESDNCCGAISITTNDTDALKDMATAAPLLRLQENTIIAHPPNTAQVFINHFQLIPWTYQLLF
ncbi:hypothetical protein FB192DRAFT_1431773 [Mucor lusitanicus]|uniref:Uncharacterized protein n=1 Tax=Mucor circinelloides f. lusitanicus TaxID=29924 RepID=A0A8H4BRR4_MUCCL|nr:hypothetical protein FB192DRAFT_1431773 [Mucor lusitanicus]